MPKRPLTERIGSVCRQCREEDEITLTHFAKKMGKSKGQLSRLESGLQGFSISVLYDYSRLLGKSVSELVVRAEGLK